MNYEKIYNNLIDRAKKRILEGYSESHHIVPKCIGGTNESSNLVDLTPEEHYLAHQLLVKIYPKNEKLAYAAIMMIPNRPTNKMYGWLRRRFSKAVSNNQKGEGNSQYNTCWITNGIKERKIKKFEEIPDGWIKQRLSPYLRDAKRKELKKEKIKKKISELETLHEIYIIEGFEGVVRQTGYPYSKPNLVQQFSRYLDSFSPQNGKTRAKKKK